MLTIRAVAVDDADALALWGEQEADLVRRYDAPGLRLPTTFDGFIVSLVGYADGGVPAASLVLRWSPYDTGAGSVELKRLWVREGYRGRGYAKVLLGRAEAIARREGATRIVLEAGDEQPEALSLYDQLGYARIPDYGEHAGEEGTVSCGLDLPTRVLVVTGSLGAGKTAVGAAVHEALGRRGARTAFLDADTLCQAFPTTPEDPVNRGLLLEALAVLAPLYRERGYGTVVLPVVLEDPDESVRLSHAFASEGGPAEVIVARVAAPDEERIARLERRETSAWWLDWARTRTVEMEGELDALGLEDVTIDNGATTVDDAAAQLLQEVGWAL
ncbi:GNAT family N-acetyltransferase [Demequina pelophila]|uniref:GNAT family N-acetyltransferase n=1 Tax=Demequina pelophila TaxID=1638984 RepID=UPI000781C592|nr:GNAT family N-acetyltransferase [Demequina pelophila]